MFSNSLAPSLVLLWVYTIAAGCGKFPKDPEKTFAKVENGILKVGITHHPPFTIVKDSGNYAGNEVELVKHFARAVNSKIEWIHLTEEELFHRLKNHEIDLIIGGITDKSPWKKHAGFSVPYLKMDKNSYVMAVPPGENAFLMRLDRFLIHRKAARRDLRLEI